MARSGERCCRGAWGKGGAAMVRPGSPAAPVLRRPVCGNPCNESMFVVAGAWSALVVVSALCDCYCFAMQCWGVSFHANSSRDLAPGSCGNFEPRRRKGCCAQ